MSREAKQDLDTKYAAQDKLSKTERQTGGCSTLARVAHDDAGPSASEDGDGLRRFGRHRRVDASRS